MTEPMRPNTLNATAARLIFEAKLGEFHAALIAGTEGQVERARDALHSALDALMDAQAAMVRQVMTGRG